MATARSVVILADNKVEADAQNIENQSLEADAQTINTVLAVQSFERGKGRFSGNIVVELLNELYSNQLNQIGGILLDCISPRSIIPSLMVKCSRQVGLSQLYKMLFGFEGSEFYLRSFDQLTGLTFREVRRVVKGAIVCGTKGIDRPVTLNPPDDYVLSDGEEIVALAEEYQDIHVNMYTDMGKVVGEERVPALQNMSRVRNIVFAGMQAEEDALPKKTLILGWRDDILDIIKLIDHRASPGSAIVIISEIGASEQVRLLEEAGFRWGQVAGEAWDEETHTLRNSTLHCYMADTTSEKDMTALVSLHKESQVNSPLPLNRGISRSLSKRSLPVPVAGHGSNPVEVVRRNAVEVVRRTTMRVMHIDPSKQNRPNKQGGEQPWQFPQWSEFSSTLIFSRDDALNASRHSDTVTDSKTLMSMLLCRRLQEDCLKKHESRTKTVAEATKTAHHAFASSFAGARAKSQRDLTTTSSDSPDDTAEGKTNPAPASDEAFGAGKGAAAAAADGAVDDKTGNIIGEKLLRRRHSQSISPRSAVSPGFAVSTSTIQRRTDVFENCMVMCEFLATSVDDSVRRHPYIGAGSFCEGFPAVDLVSKIMAMAAFRLGSHAIYEALLADGGSDICLVSAMRFIRPVDKMSVNELSLKLQETDCILIAFKSSYNEPLEIALGEHTKTKRYWEHGLLAVLTPSHNPGEIFSS